MPLVTGRDSTFARDRARALLTNSVHRWGPFAGTVSGVEGKGEHMAEEDAQTATIELVKDRLNIIAKHTDNWTNGSLGVHTPEDRVRVADLVIDVARSEADAALQDLARAGL